MIAPRSRPLRIIQRYKVEIVDIRFINKINYY